MLLALAIAGVAGFIAYTLVKKKSQTPPVAPAEQAAVPALTPVVIATPHTQTLMLESATTHAELLRLFRQRLSELLDLPGPAVSKASVLRALDAQGVPDSVQERVHGVWQQCEAAVYAPGGLGTDQTVQETARDATSALDQIRLRLAA